MNGNPTILSATDSKLFESIAQDCGTTVAHVYTTDCFTLSDYPESDDLLLALGNKLAEEHGYDWQGGEVTVHQDADEVEFNTIFMVKEFDGNFYNLSLDRRGEIEISIA